MVFINAINGMDSIKGIINSMGSIYTNIAKSECISTIKTAKDSNGMGSK